MLRMDALDQMKITIYQVWENLLLFFRVQESNQALFGKEYDVLYIDIYADSDAQKSICRLWVKTLDGASDKFELYTNGQGKQ